MTSEDTFRPKLGKIRSLGSKHGRRYVNQVLRAVAFAGGSPGKAKGFTGRRYGRGAGVGSLLAVRDKHAGFRQRRVIVKSRIVKFKGGKTTAAAAHLRYIQRDGVTRDGAPGALYGKDMDAADGKAFLGRCEGDRHQFRFIVAPEDGDQYDDLKPMIRKLMARMEEDLGTPLDWVAVDHFNTGHPHSHVVLRGKDDRDRDLIIARDYISRGMRERAAEIVTFDLGPRTDREIEKRLSQEIEQERFTSLDRRLIQEQDTERLIRPLKQGTVSQQALRAGRLQKLSRLGLAEEIAPGTWRLAENLEQDLRALGLRGDIIKTMHRDLKAQGQERPAADLAIYDPAHAGERPLVGRVVSKGLHDEMTDRRYLVLDGTDGFSHYVELGESLEEHPIAEGSIVAVRPRTVAAKEADNTVAEIAARNGGRYSADLHLRHDRTARPEFVATHVRRLEAMRKLTGVVERNVDGTWTIAADHVERAMAYERVRATRAPAVVTVLSPLSLERQVRTDGATWLDGELVRRDPEPLRDAGFGRETKQALERRRVWLIAQDLAREEQSRTIYRANLLAVLRRREMTRAGQAMAADLGLTYRDVKRGERIEGVYRKPVDLASGRYAAIATRSKELVLVPWRAVLDRNLGREVSGLVRDSGISWTLGRARGRDIS
jgi:type IV secretory pathway VirD2 relaxase